MGFEFIEDRLDLPTAGQVRRPVRWPSLGRIEHRGEQSGRSGLDIATAVNGVIDNTLDDVFGVHPGVGESYLTEP